MANIRKKDVFDSETRCNLNHKHKTYFSKISGYSAKMMSFLLDSFMKSLVLSQCYNESQLCILKNLEIEDEPTEFPYVKPKENIPISEFNLEDIMLKKEEWPYKTSYDYHHGYLNKTITPLDVAKRIIEISKIEEFRQLNCISQIREEDVLISAIESTKRYEENKHLSVLDGVPFFVKDHMEVKNYTIHQGSDSYSMICSETMFPIQKLQDFGALLMGIYTMVPFGTNALGSSTSKKYPPCKNPWDIKRYCGGSSSGAGVLVGCGVVPFCVASDSLGSIRVPSGFNGVVGLRPTTFRVSVGKYNESKERSPYLTIGPIANSVSDAALMLYVMSGKDPGLIYNFDQPCLIPPNFKTFDITKIKFGVCKEFIANTLSPSILDSFNKVIDQLTSINCQVVPIAIPELKEIYICINAGMSYCTYKLPETLGDLDLLKNNNDLCTKLQYYIGEDFSEKYLDKIDRQRTRALKIMENIFNEVDIILFPNTGTLPPLQYSSDNSYGVFDFNDINDILIFNFLSPFTGVPSLCLNIDYDLKTGMPISLQMLASWWREDLLLSIGNVIEQYFPLTRKPSVYYSSFN